MARNLRLLAFTIFVFHASLNAQYLETFSTPNKGYMLNMADDFSGVNWTLSPWALDNAAPNFQSAGRDAGDYFYTSAAGKLESSDLDHEVYWESPIINISAAGTVSFSVDLSWTGFDTDGTLNSCISGPHGTNATLDVIKVLYSINGGAYTMIPNAVGGASCATIGYVFGSANSGAPGSLTVTKPGLSGNTIRIRVVVNTNVTAEVVTIDNVSIPQAGVNLGCTQATVTVVPSNIVCNGASSGSIKVTASGATAPYNVSWSGTSSGNPAGNEIAASGGNYTISNLAAGAYTVTVTDANNCAKASQVTILSAPIIQSAITTSATCGKADGTIDLSVSGGNPGYTYAWSNGATTQDITAAAGNYSVAVTDNSSPGCATVAFYTIAAATNGAYLETFSVPNKGYLLGLTNNFFGVNWTLSPWITDQPETGIGRGGDDYFQTTAGGKLEAIDTDAEVNWTSPLLNISASGPVQFSVDLGWTTFDPEDYISVEYSLNGGAYMPLPNAVGGGAKTIQYASGVDITGSTTITKTGLSGNTLQIRVAVLSNSNADVVTIDNVSVPQTVSLCICPVFSVAPPNVTITNSLCNSGCTVTGGLITAPAGTPCPAGSTLQYQVNGGNWTTTLPTYAQTGPAQSIKTRCSCNEDGSVVSAESAPVITAPGTCALPVVNAPTVTQPTCALTTGTIVVNATGVGVLEYSINNGTSYSASATFSNLTAGNYNIRVRRTTHPGCFTAYTSNPVVINVAPAAPTWYKDSDNDGYSNGETLIQCTQPAGYKLAANLTATSGDCNDNNAAINPGATEICDGIDNDCDNQIDEGFTPVLSGGATVNTSITPGQTIRLQQACSILGLLESNGGAPVSGNITAKVLVQAVQPTYKDRPYLKRSYEIAPATNVNTATGRITLYFLQSEFDAFNAVPGHGPDLPTNPAASTNNFAIYKFSGTSSDGTGLPGTYPTPGKMLTVLNGDIQLVWNATLQAWAATFETTGFSGFFAGNNDATILPLSDLLVFKGEVQGKDNLLSWEVLAGSKIKNFGIEKSTNGTDFQAIGSVSAVTGMQGYSFIDHQPGVDKSFYRLRLTEPDGRTLISNVILIQRSGAITAVSVYPNPVKNNLHINIQAQQKGMAEIRITNANGSSLMSRTIEVVPGANLMQQSLAPWAPGLYIIHVTMTQEGKTQTFKLIKE